MQWYTLEVTTTKGHQMSDDPLAALEDSLANWRHHQAILATTQAHLRIEIQAAIDAGHTEAEMARMTGIARNTIRNWNQNR